MDHPTLNEVVKLADQLSEPEKHILRQHLDQSEIRLPTDMPTEERIAALERAFEHIREALTEEQLDLIETAMNVEYIEPSDDLE